jgi:hypothetical protein
MVRGIYPEDAELSDELAAAIGHMVIQWGHLEDNAICLTALLLGANHFEFRSAGVNIPTKAKLDTLEAVAHMVLPARRAATIKAICDSARSLSAERNRVVHGSWLRGTKPDVAKRHTYTARGRLAHKDELVSVKRLRGYIEEVRKVQRRINHHLSRYGFYKGTPGPSPDRWKPKKA